MTMVPGTLDTDPMSDIRNIMTAKGMRRLHRGRHRPGRADPPIPSPPDPPPLDPTQPQLE